jgi:hypothetical protein
MKDLSKLTNVELCSFLSKWGSALAKEGGKQNIHYQSCVDAYFALRDEPLRFYESRGKLARALAQLADVLEGEIKRKTVSADKKSSVDTFIEISTRILKGQKVTQVSLF